MSNNIKTNKRKPISIIVHSTNIIGYRLAKTLAEEGSKVILVDQFDTKSKKLLQDLKSFGDIEFVDIKGLDSLMSKIAKVDYLFFLQAPYLLSKENFESKDFLEESNNLNICLKVAQKHNTKLSLITTILFNEMLMYETQNIHYSKPSPYSAQELQKYSETLVAEQHDKSKANARILRLGTIIGEENNIEHYKILSNLFEDSIKRGTINIIGEGLDINYLINIEDAIYGILKLTFQSKTNGEVISLCNNNEYTVLSIAYKLLEINPNATEIKFSPEEKKRPIIYTQYLPAPNAEEYGWKQKFTLEESITKTLESKHHEHRKTWSKETNTENSYKQKLEEIRRKKQGYKKGQEKKKQLIKNPFSFIKHFKKDKEPKQPTNKIMAGFKIIALLIIFYFLIYPIISIIIGCSAIYINGRELIRNSSNLENQEIQNRLENINSHSSKINKNFNNLKWLFILIQQREIHDNTALLFYTIETGTEGGIELNKGIEPLRQYANEFEPAIDFQQDSPRTTREYTDILKDLDTNSSKIENAIYKINNSVVLSKQIDKNVYPEFTHEYFSIFENTITRIEKRILPLQKIASFLPQILGVEERQRYLILLQNPAELRSTGGWISSYALIAVEGGQIRQLIVDDIYNLEGELKNQRRFFNAPNDMGEALNISEWSLSLANWDPHFPDAANNAIFFVTESGKATSIDAVITIDIHVLQSLLQRWGGINIPGERDLITDRNIYEKVFLMNQTFTPGQSQKATFLANLANETLKKLLSSNTQEYNYVLDIILESLESKHILLFLKDKNAQNYFSRQNWTGEINSNTQTTPFSIEWNWGGNKSNLYIERGERIIAEIVNTNEITYNYSLILQNNSASNSYPQGEYKNYTRIFIPETADIKSVNGFQNNEYETLNNRGFKIIGGWFNIPIQTTKELSIEYNISNTNNIFAQRDETINMGINLFKQPGTGKNDKARIEIIYPENWSVKKYEDFDKIGTRLTQDLILNQDKSYTLEWEQK